MPRIITGIDGQRHLAAGVNECSRCFDPIPPGREYCRRHAEELQAGLALGECAFCKADLPCESDGYCPTCGASLINPPAFHAEHPVTVAVEALKPARSRHLVLA
jgi:predicted amidophosphoribosyltransferase